MRQWAGFLGVYLACVALHTLAFKSPGERWSEALLQWPGLYVLYFMLAHWVAEVVLRQRPRRGGDLANR